MIFESQHQALIYVLLAVLLFIVLRLFVRPLRLSFAALSQMGLGLLGLLGLNFAGGLFGVGLALNAVTVAVAAFLGLPGVSLLLFLQALQ